MKSILSIIIILFMTPLFAQSSCKITFETLRHDLTGYLIQNGEIHDSETDFYLRGERTIRISGFFNELSEGEVKDGVYAFFLKRTMAKGYFLIVEKNHYQILDLTTREGLEKSIKDVLDFLR